MKLLDIDCVSMFLNNDLMVEETSDCCKVITGMGVAPISVDLEPGDGTSNSVVIQNCVNPCVMFRI